MSRYQFTPAHTSNGHGDNLDLANAATMTTSRSSSPPFQPSPPPLNYSLRERKRSIAITWTIIVAQSCFLPVILYYSLQLTSLSYKNVLTIVSVIPAISMLTFFIRTYKLLRPDDDSRPLGTGRWAIDFFHINYGLGVVVISIIIAVSLSTGPNVRVFCLPVSYLVTVVAAQLLLTSALSAVGVRNPFAFSSVARGEPMRPAVYTIVEDIVAVDGAGGRAYRRRLNARYEASPVFRRLLAELNFVWGLVCLVTGVITIILIATVENVNIYFFIAWTLPWLVVAILTLATFRWTAKRLVDEKRYYAKAAATTSFA